MPNLITKFTQTISEAFKGPRTKDVEFDKKVEEFKNIEKAIVDLREILKNYSNHTKGIKHVNNEIKNCIKVIYGNTHFSTVYDIIAEINDSINSHFDDLITNLNNILAKSTEWLAGYSNLKTTIEQREKLRKVFDHYDEKLENIVSKRQERIRKNEIETTKDLIYYERVS